MMKGFLFLVIMCCSVSIALPQSQAQEQEAPLKAAFIYNFTHYIEWDNDIHDEFVIGVIGSSPVATSLSMIAKTKTVNNKKIIIQYYNKPEEIEDCQVLFIPQNLPYSLRTILDNTVKGTLTVSEEEGYGKLGAAFNFVIRNEKLKFEANRKSIAASGLKAGSQLLKLAIIVE